MAHVELDDKTNEIPVAQALIAELHLQGCLFTFDALHCQKKTFQAAAAVGSRVLVQVTISRRWPPRSIICLRR